MSMNPPGGVKHHIQLLVACICGAERVLAGWSAGNFSSSRSSAPLPMGGMLLTVLWA